MKSLERPKIELSLTVFDKTIEAIVLLILIVFWFFTSYHYKSLPDVIPTHFKANGEVDGYGLKWTILTLPSIATLFYFGLTILAKYPHKFNYTATITKGNAKKLYSIATQMLRIMKLALIIVFFSMEYETVQIAMNIPDPLTKWYVLFDFTMIFLPLFYFLIKSSQNS
jgi:uncharacterized membrane protein